MRTYLRNTLSKIKYFLLNVHRVFQDKKVVVIVSTMRSGSTLLKALLANSPDTTHLSEVDFQKFNKLDYWKLKMKYKQKIIVMKKPCWYTNADHYPVLPDLKNMKIVVLIRNPYDTVSSIKEMAKIRPKSDQGLENNEYVNDYWCKVYKKILKCKILDQPNATLVRYTELVQDPIRVTEELFKFIGSEQIKGVDTYSYPKDGMWKWDNDDGGEVIKTLKVVDKKRDKNDQRLIDTIEASKCVEEITTAYDLTS